MEGLGAAMEGLGVASLGIESGLGAGGMVSTVSPLTVALPSAVSMPRTSVSRYRRRLTSPPDSSESRISSSMEALLRRSRSTSASSFAESSRRSTGSPSRTRTERAPMRMSTASITASRA